MNLGIQITILTLLLWLQFCAWVDNINYKEHNCSKNYLVAKITAMTSAQGLGQGLASVIVCGGNVSTERMLNTKLDTLA